MGKYVVNETLSFLEKVDADMRVIVEKILASPLPPLKAILLTGGYGRGEGTPFLNQGVQTPYNDYDLVIVCDSLSRQKKQAFQQHLYAVEAELGKELGIAVDLALIPINFLKDAEFTLFNYEMKKGSQILWGDPEILKIMPHYQVEKLPLIEGTRLLLNRGVLLWENCNRLALKTPLSAEEEKTFVKNLYKMHLAFGDILFIVQKHYESDYRKKRKHINTLTFNKPPPHLEEITKNYLRAIDFKHDGDPRLYPASSITLLMEETLASFAPIFLWFESCRLATDLQDLHAYIDPSLLLKHDHSPLWKRVGLNFILFKQGSLKPSWRWSLLHPRHRLFCALLLLFQKNRPQKDNNLLNKLLHCDDHAHASSFRKLWQRLS